MRISTLFIATLVASQAIRYPEVDDNLTLDDNTVVLEKRLKKVTAKKNADGSCYSHTIASGETCSFLMSKFSLTLDQLNKYNKKTFNWLGCDNGHPWIGDKLCVSDGTPPKPAVNQNAECGPQAPGSLYNSKCPLNACCSQFGYCGYTASHCSTTKSSTGAPGTSGCLSNCNYGAFTNTPASTFRNVVYYQNLNNKLKLDPSKVPASYDTVHYAFVELNSDFSINSASLGSNFDKFKKIAAKKVISIGGGSSDASKASFFISAVSTAANREKMATNLVNFINLNSLDGIDLDWEFPGSSDFAGTSSKDGQNYLSLLKTIKSKLASGKTLSMAIPVSYYYLKNYPIKDMQAYLDYMIAMTYDFHGQWEYTTSDSVACHVDKAQTMDSLKLLAKAGIDLKKVMGGVANYGRSFKLKSSSCTAVGCAFTGPTSGATPGSVSQSAGILIDSEINALASSKRKTKRFTDSSSGCDVLVYDKNQWVAWMKKGQREALVNQYRSIGLGGSATWSANYF